jgi:hypothetical protein
MVGAGVQEGAAKGGVGGAYESFFRGDAGGLDPAVVQEDSPGRMKRIVELFQGEKGSSRSSLEGERGKQVL